MARSLLPSIIGLLALLSSVCVRTARRARDIGGVEALQEKALVIRFRMLPADHPDLKRARIRRTETPRMLAESTDDGRSHGPREER